MAMREEGSVFDTDQTRRLKQAFNLALAYLGVETSDHDVRKRLARTLLKVAKRRAEHASPEALARMTIDKARAESAPPDHPSALLATMRRSPSPTIIPWHLVQSVRDRRGRFVEPG